MTQRERAVGVRDSVEKAGVYNATPAGVTAVTTDTKPTDLIRWGPIFGGLFAALATLNSEEHTMSNPKLTAQPAVTEGAGARASDTATPASGKKSGPGV